MKLDVYRYARRGGWSAPFADLDSPQTLLVVFGAANFRDEPGPFLDLRAAFPDALMIGCSTAGEIHDTLIDDDTLAVAVAHFETATLASTWAEVSGPATSYGAGRKVAEALAGDDLRCVLVLSDGLAVNGSELVRGLNSVLPGSVVVTGGLAGDGDRFESTWVLVDGLPREGSVVALGIYGDVTVGHGSRGGWDIFGPERIVTRSEGNVLYELDGQPALDLYRTYLGEQAAGLPATGLLFPLALRSHAGDSKQLVRTILGIDQADRSLIFAGDVPQGHLAQLMQANFDRLVGGAEQAAEAARVHGNGGPCLAIAISCVGRRLVLGGRSEEEVEATLEVLPAGTRQVGFYSYGEISPYATGSCDLHNQTMTLTTISEP